MSLKYDEENIHLFYYWMYERQNIYYKRFILKQKPPWTKDKILQEYKFTNVHRCLDRTTIYYHDTIGKFEDERDIVFATFIHRLFNNIPTMQRLQPYLGVQTFNLGKVTKLLDGIRRQGGNIWTTAHMTTGVRFSGSDDKLENILYLIKLIQDDIEKIFWNIKGAKSLEDLYNRTRMVHGFGPFLAYQYILDMVNVGIHDFSLNSFAVAGPGCKRGLRHVFPDLNNFMDGMVYLRENQHEFFEKYNFDYKFLDSLGGKEKGIHLGDIENSCCEFSKYHRAFYGSGRPRNRFVETKEKLRAIK